MTKYPALQTCLEVRAADFIPDGTIQRAFRAIKSLIWQS